MDDGLLLTAIREMLEEVVEAVVRKELDARNLKRSKDQTAAERMRRYRARQRNVTLHSMRNASEGKAVTLRNGHDHIGEGDIVCEFPSLRGDIKVCRSFVSELIDAYPAVMVAQEIDRAKLWVAANPTKRKTNVRKFLTNWMARSQERGGSK